MAGRETDPSRALVKLGPDALAAETNAVRAPMWGPHRTTQLDLLAAPSILYGGPFRLTKATDRLTADDLRLFAELTSAYLRAGCPADRRVPFALRDAARKLGVTAPGGKDLRLVRESMRRLIGVSIESILRRPGGGDGELRGWGLVDGYRLPLRGGAGGQGWIELNSVVVDLLRSGSVTHLHGPTWDAIASEDDLAGRLWTFLESENLDAGHRYHLFSTLPNGLQLDRNMPAIADLLCLDWAERKKIAARVRRACAVIGAADERYTLSVVPAKDRGMWLLEARRTKFRAVASKVTQGLPPAILAAWRGAYTARRPSAAQARTLSELADRRGSGWVIDRLGAGGQGDALRRLLSEDKAAAKSQERTWEDAKAVENRTGPSSLRDLIQAVQKPLQTGL